jgi:hypothetical protein
MRTIWVVILSLIALVVGAFGGLAWKGATGSLDGIHIACETANVAQKSGLMTKAQSDDTVDRMLKRIEKSDRNIDVFGKELKTGCPTFTKIGRPK